MRYNKHRGAAKGTQPGAKKGSQPGAVKSGPKEDAAGFIRRTVRVVFTGEFCLGSGLGDGHLADTFLARDHEGFPCVPGRSFKGALRESAWRMGLARADLRLVEEILWGTRSTATETNRSGLLRVGQGRLAEDLRRLLTKMDRNEREATVRDMTVHRVQTALENGQVKEGSLRTLECGIPGLAFFADLEIAHNRPAAMDGPWLDAYLACVCAGLKSMGGGRSRGLGRCRAALVGDTRTGGPALPPKLDEKALREFLGEDARLVRGTDAPGQETQGGAL